MADLRYRIAKIPARKNQEPHWSRPYRKLSVVLAVLRVKLAVAGAPYSVNVRGRRPGGVKTLALAISRVRNYAKGETAPGHVYIVRGSSGTGYMLRVVAVAPHVEAPSSATPAIQQIYEYVFSKYPEAQNWGICNCRKINGSSTWSQHSWCNGLDVAGPKAVLDRIARDVRNSNLPVAQLLWQVADHYDHIHFSGSPLKGGTPPCAKG